MRYYGGGMPIRTCVGCRRADDPDLMLRVVRTGSGWAVDRVAPGRGAWLHPGCGATALKRRAIPRALRTDAGQPEALAALVADVDALAPAWANGRPTD